MNADAKKNLVPLGLCGKIIFEFYSMFILAFPDTAVGAGVARKFSAKAKCKLFIPPDKSDGNECCREKKLCAFGSLWQNNI